LSCAKVMTCTTCACATPKIACLDGGGINVTGCETACERLTSSCTDAGTAAEGGHLVDGGTPVDGTPVDVASGPTACLGAPIVPQASSNNTSLNPQQVPFAAGGVAIFGQSIGNGFGEPGGYFDLSGMLGDTDVNVQIVMSPCSTTICPPDITFVFGTTDGGTVSVSSAPESCGSAVVRTNGGGHLLLSVSKSGDSGEENGVGIVLRPIVTDAGGDAAGD